MEKLTTSQNIDLIKNDLINAILLLGTTFGFLAFLASLIPFSADNINADFFFDIFGLGALYLTYFLRKKLSLMVKSNLIIAMLYLLFISDVFENGLDSPDFVIVVLIPFVSTLIYRFWISISLYIVAIGLYLIIGFLFITGVISSSNYTSDETFFRWLEVVLVLSVVSIMITLFLDKFHKTINDLIDNLEKQNDNLLEREFLLSTIKDNFPRSYMSVIDSDFRITMTGGSEFKTQGINPEDYNGLTVREVLEPIRDEPLNTILESYRKTLEGEGQVFQIKLGDQYQTYKTMPLPDKNGEIKSFLSVVENITESVENKHLIEENLNEKNVLLQEIHHRVKNNLAVVSGLLSLQSFKIKDPKSKFILEKSTNRIMSIAKVHEMLYESKNFNRIPFERYINELATIILDSMNYDAKSIQFSTDIAVDFISINHGVPLGIIFNELITNSVKYGFYSNNNNVIKIKVSQNDGRFEVIYEDNGIGIENLEVAISKSLGFTLIESLMNQIEADFEYDTNGKFKLCFSFPDDIKSNQAQVIN